VNCFIKIIVAGSMGRLRFKRVKLMKNRKRKSKRWRIKFNSEQSRVWGKLSWSLTGFPVSVSKPS
jgi:hypothetical protein